MRLPLECPLLGTWPATQACALAGNQTGDPLVLRLVLNPLSHTSQGQHFLMWSFMVGQTLGHRNPDTTLNPGMNRGL